VTKVWPATSTAWSAVQADGTGKPAKRHPALEFLPLGFSSSDIVGIDTARLRDGFIILNDASGRPLYELPIRLQPEMVAESYVTSKYIFVVYNVKYSYAEDGQKRCVLATLRPSGTVDATIRMGALNAWINRRDIQRPEEAFDGLVSRLPGFFFPAVIRANVSARSSRIAGKRAAGDYLSPRDAEPELNALKEYVLDTINSALVACPTLLDEEYYPQLAFERPLVQTRALRKAAQTPEGAIPTNTARNAIRLLNAQAIHAMMYGYTKGSSGNYGKVPYPPDYYGFIEGVKVSPFPIPYDMRSVAMVPGIMRTGTASGIFKVMADGSLGYKPANSTEVLTIRP